MRECWDRAFSILTIDFIYLVGHSSDWPCTLDSSFHHAVRHLCLAYDLPKNVFVISPGLTFQSTYYLSSHSHWLIKVLLKVTKYPADFLRITEIIHRIGDRVVVF